MMEATRVCKECDAEKRIKSFATTGKGARYRLRTCNSCIEIRKKERNPNRLAERRTQSANWRATNQTSVIESRDKYRARNNEKTKQKEQERRRRVVQHYGGKCACCGEATYEFLAIDHINGGGNKHRKEVGGGSLMVKWIIKNNFPPLFQILCHNCNNAKAYYGYCPHHK